MSELLEHVGLPDLPRVAAKIITHSGNRKLWTFYGEMGSGKTTLIKEICAQLGVSDEISSPTYSLVNEYKTRSGQTIYHFDFYRLKNIDEAYDIGYEDYFYSNNVCLIEWPENISALLERDEALKIVISKTGDTTRTIAID